MIVDSPEQKTQGIFLPIWSTGVYSTHAEKDREIFQKTPYFA